MARVEPPLSGDERTILLAFLDYYRETMVLKIEGLSEEQARWKPAPTANSLLNLIYHLAGVEAWWFEGAILGKDPSRDRDAELRELPAEVTIASAVDRYRKAWARSNEIGTGVDLDGECRHPKVAGMNVRWVIVHMIEETCRHAGHADITRELIDGSVGD